MSLARLTVLLVAWLAIAAPTVAADFRSDRITVTARGRGPDVVLIPGLGSSEDVWRRHADRLDDLYRVHLVRVRGFQSGAAGANASGPVTQPVAAEVARYLRHERVRGAALIGHSLGGQVALLIARDAPETTGRVMTVDSPAYFGALIDPIGDGRLVPAMAEAARQAVLLLGDDRVRSTMSPLIQRIQQRGALGFLANFGAGSTGDRRVLAQGLYDVLTLDLRPSLPGLRQPVKVLYAWNPGLRFSRAEVDAFFRRNFTGLRDGRFVRVEPSSHMIMLDQPQRLAAEVDAFLE